MFFSKPSDLISNLNIWQYIIEKSENAYKILMKMTDKHEKSFPTLGTYFPLSDFLEWESFVQILHCGDSFDYHIIISMPLDIHWKFRPLWDGINLNKSSCEFDVFFFFF